MQIMTYDVCTVQTAFVNGIDLIFYTMTCSNVQNCKLVR